jgi:nitrate/TMAO reductase-like tetraheme cytochrome c subunit
MPTSLILAVLLITIILAVLVAVRPSLTVARGGKILAFLAFFIFPVFAGLLGLENHMERAKQTSFCLSCHIMGQYGQSLYVDDA